MGAFRTLVRPAAGVAERPPGHVSGWAGPPSLRWLVAGATVAAALVPVVVYLVVAAHRIDYPYELDWLEGGAVGLVDRVLHGQSLYVSPTLRYAPWAYTPLYTYVSAGVAELTGLGFLPLRIVSVAASIVGGGLLYAIVARAGRDRVASVVAAGVYAATFRISGQWFDVGRLDSFFLAVTLIAVFAGLRVEGVRGGVLLGVLAFLAFFSKQTALVVLVPALLYLAVVRRRAGVSALLVLVVLIAASTLVLDARTDGWYRYFVAGGDLAGQAWVPSEWAGFWTGDLLEHLWPVAALLAVGLVAIIAAAHTPRPRSTLGRFNQHAYLLIVCAGMLAGSWLSRLHSGGYNNVLLPAFAACAILGGVAVAALRRRGIVTSTIALALVLVQVVVLWYPPASVIPTREDRIAGAELEARLRALPGPILVFRHPWYSAELGKGLFAQSEGVTDILRSTADRGPRALRANLRTALDRYGIRTVVLDETYDEPYFEPELSRDFRLLPGTITPHQLNPLTDVRTSPALVFIRR